MPQLAIEYSSNLAGAFDARGFALHMHALVVATVDTGLHNCKTRLIELGHVVIGDGSPDHAMIHVDLRILSGRSEAQKQALGQAVLAALQEAVSDLRTLKLQLTVEVRDLDRANYHKKVL